MAEPSPERHGKKPRKKKKGPRTDARTAPEAASRRPLKSRIDVDSIIFDGDLDLREALMQDAVFARTVERAHPAARVGAMRRELLLKSLKLTRDIAPDLFTAIERARAALGLKASVEAYCVPSPTMNAFVTPPEHDRVLVGVSNSVLERMDARELAFVVGHELGHVLFDHFAMAPPVLVESDASISPLQVARIYAWMRYAELSADRVGLICCGDADAAVRAFFKLTSGLCDDRFLANARSAAAQLSELPTSAMESSEEDWFCTHPYGPLRIKAIDLFARSETYHSVIGKVGGEISEAQLEREVAVIMRLMDPSFSHEPSADGELARDFLAVGGLTVAMADGALDRSEERVLERLLGEGGLSMDAEALRERSEAGYDARLTELGRQLRLRLPLTRRRKLVEDLCAVALADERLTETEIDALVHCATLLAVDPFFIQEALARVGHALD